MPRAVNSTSFPILELSAPILWSHTCTSTFVCCTALVLSLDMNPIVWKATTPSFYPRPTERTRAEGVTLNLKPPPLGQLGTNIAYFRELLILFLGNTLPHGKRPAASQQLFFSFLPSLNYEPFTKETVKEMSDNQEIQQVAAVAQEAKKRTEKPVEQEPEFCLDCNPADDGEPGPADRVVYPADVVEFAPEDDCVYVVGTKDGKVTRIGGLENMPNLKVRDCGCDVCELFFFLCFAM